MRPTHDDGVVSYAADGIVEQVLYFDNDPTLPFDDVALAIPADGRGNMAVTGSAFGSSSYEDIGTFSERTTGLFADGFESGSVDQWSAASMN